MSRCSFTLSSKQLELLFSYSPLTQVRHLPKLRSSTNCDGNSKVSSCFSIHWRNSDNNACFETLWKGREEKVKRIIIIKTTCASKTCKNMLSIVIRPSAIIFKMWILSLYWVASLLSKLHCCLLFSFYKSTNYLDYTHIMQVYNLYLPQL